MYGRFYIVKLMKVISHEKLSELYNFLLYIKYLVIYSRTAICASIIKVNKWVYMERHWTFKEI